MLDHSSPAVVSGAVEEEKEDEGEEVEEKGL